MKALKIESYFFPENEHLLYELNLLGAKGSIQINTKKESQAIEIRCLLLASLVFPPKKLVDSQITTRIEADADAQSFVLKKYIDQDYKSEVRRSLEIKKHGIETRYTKFDEERGFIELPKNLILPEIVDPLSVPFLIRGPEFLKNKEPRVLNLLTRTGIVKVLLTPGEEKKEIIEALAGERNLVRVTAQSDAVDKMKGPYLSPDLELWFDLETGLVAEIAYPFLANLGKASLKLKEKKP